MQAHTAVAAQCDTADIAQRSACSLLTVEVQYLF
jgi:hypothetical protein